ncbi:VOC family protein [Paenibacillus thalictri]|uniref:VOC family protein n=1 Tax=Paenibacillus thalictri TaxID=2527873 RepID=A0A4Q9DR02_9BACL|nr:VOC family protein [Paenibacillus thalictri]TBL79034.1 VOC family protein [Paenibacillus thalictri]
MEENSGVLDRNVIAQVALVVHDIEKTSRAYADFFGIETPTWKLTDAWDQTQAVYRGKPTEARAKLAFMNFGSVVIELIEPDHHPSIWREFLDERGEGFHHIAFKIAGMENITGLMEQKFHMPLVQKGEYTGGRYAYIDSLKDLKVLIELLENDNN